MCSRQIHMGRKWVSDNQRLGRGVQEVAAKGCRASFSGDENDLRLNPVNILKMTEL